MLYPLSQEKFFDFVFVLNELSGVYRDLPFLPLSSSRDVDRLDNGVALVSDSLRCAVIIYSKIAFMSGRNFVNVQDTMPILQQAERECFPLIRIPNLNRTDHAIFPPDPM